MIKLIFFAGPAFDECSLSDVALLVSSIGVLVGAGFVYMGFKSLKEVQSQLKLRSGYYNMSPLLKSALALIVMAIGLMLVMYFGLITLKALGCLS